MSFRVVVPARFASLRLPGKPLLEIQGEPMIVRVAQAAARSAADEVIVATDEERIALAVRAAGFQALVTGTDHQSGSDRVMEVVEVRHWEEDEIVINVQGDEPLIPGQVIDQLAGCLEADASLASATLCEAIRDPSELQDSNVVKVVRALDGRALYFSRAPIPYRRDHAAGTATGGSDSNEPDYGWRHIGIYAYRVSALRRFVSLARGQLERLESLEQLRMLENGMTMQVQPACVPVPGGVDTPEDLERVRDRFAELMPTSRTS